MSTFLLLGDIVLLILKNFIVLSVEFDQRQAYSGSLDMTVRIWNTQNGECPHILKPMSSIHQVRISPSYLVSSHLDGTLHIWDPVSGNLNYQLSGLAKTFSTHHDDRKIFIASDGSLKLWDIHGNKLLKDLPLDGADAFSAIFASRYCASFVQREGHYWLDVWEFADEDGWMEEGQEEEILNDGSK